MQNDQPELTYSLPSHQGLSLEAITGMQSIGGISQ